MFLSSFHFIQTKSESDIYLKGRPWLCIFNNLYGGLSCAQSHRGYPPSLPFIMRLIETIIFAQLINSKVSYSKWKTARKQNPLKHIKNYNIIIAKLYPCNYWGLVWWKRILVFTCKAWWKWRLVTFGIWWWWSLFVATAHYILLYGAMRQVFTSTIQSWDTA